MFPIYKYKCFVLFPIYERIFFGEKERKNRYRFLPPRDSVGEFAERMGHSPLNKKQQSLKDFRQEQKLLQQTSQ